LVYESPANADIIIMIFTPKAGLSLGFALFMLVNVPAGLAGYDYKFESRETGMGQFESEISAKLERGLTNVLFGWTEVFRTPARWSNDIAYGTFKAVTLGIPYGAMRAVGRTVVGVYEGVTFYAPQRPIFEPIQGNIV